MPLRRLEREQAWLLPPTLEELLPPDHPARFVAEFVESLDFGELGISLSGEAYGAPAYHPMALLSVWVYGFMSGVRSSRKLEAACRDQIPYLYLTAMQQPDHNTLWRFYKDNRASMRALLKRTVRTAVAAGLVELAIAAVDGTKVMANAAKERTYDSQGLNKLLERTDKAIAQLESHNEGGDEPQAPRLPEELKSAQALRERIQQAIDRLQQEDGSLNLKELNLTDTEARLMKSRQGIVSGYNAQAVVSALKGGVVEGGGLVVIAAEVVNEPDDTHQLTPMLKQAVEMTGHRVKVALADGGYSSADNLDECQQMGQKVAIAERQGKAVDNPYHRSRFSYDVHHDRYICPQGKELVFRGIKAREGRPQTRVYRASGRECRSCPAFGTCTKDRQGRAIETGPHEELVRRHRQWMSTKEAKALYARRKEMVEPVFGVMKEQQGARRFLLRGLTNVKAEWAALAAAFNLRTLWKVWRSQGATYQGATCQGGSVSVAAA